MKLLTGVVLSTALLATQVTVVYAERASCRIRADGVQECVYNNVSDDNGNSITYERRERADGSTIGTTSYGDSWTERKTADGSTEVIFNGGE